MSCSLLSDCKSFPLGSFLLLLRVTHSITEATGNRSEGGNRQNRLHLDSRTPSWAGLWTLSYVPRIYGNNIPTGEPDPGMEEPQGSYLGSLSLKEHPNHLCNRIESFILLCLLGNDHRLIDNCLL